MDSFKTLLIKEDLQQQQQQLMQKNGLETIVKKAGHVAGKPLDSFKTLYERRLYKKQKTKQLMQMKSLEKIVF